MDLDAWKFEKPDKTLGVGGCITFGGLTAHPGGGGV